MKGKFLVFTSNTSFNKRACDLLRREYIVVQLDSDFKYNENGTLCLDIPSSETLISQIKYHQVDYFLFSSEYLLFLNSRVQFSKLLSIITSVKEECKDVTFIFVGFEEPVFLKESTGIGRNEFYKKNLEEIILECEKGNWLVFRRRNYFTHVASDWQNSQLDIEENVSVLSVGSHADEIINDVINTLQSDASSILAAREQEFNLNIYNEIRSSFYGNLPKEIELNNSSLESLVAHQKECAVEVLYRKDPGEKVNNRVIADIRFGMGVQLYWQIPENVLEKLHFIIPVPETGKYYAQGFASASKLPYIEALYKQKEIGRSFDIADSQRRNVFLNKKLGIYPDLVANKCVGVIDEAIFTGSTLKVVVHLLRSANVKGVYLFIPSPICKSQCMFNMQPQRSILSKYTTLENIAGYFNVDGVFFQNLKIFQETMIESKHACIKCFK
jgi:amidophosphoribosyltransferase